MKGLIIAKLISCRGGISVPFPTPCFLVAVGCAEMGAGHYAAWGSGKEYVRVLAWRALSWLERGMKRLQPRGLGWSPPASQQSRTWMDGWMGGVISTTAACEAEHSYQSQLRGPSHLLSRSLQVDGDFYVGRFLRCARAAFFPTSCAPLNLSNPPLCKNTPPVPHLPSLWCSQSDEATSPFPQHRQPSRGVLPSGQHYKTEMSPLISCRCLFHPGSAHTVIMIS